MDSLDFSKIDSLTYNEMERDRERQKQTEELGRGWVRWRDVGGCERDSKGRTGEKRKKERVETGMETEGQVRFLSRREIMQSLCRPR